MTGGAVLDSISLNSAELTNRISVIPTTGEPFKPLTSPFSFKISGHVLFAHSCMALLSAKFGAILTIDSFASASGCPVAGHVFPPL